MDESKRDPREDISLIRQIMERAMDGMKTIAPWFRALGLVWMIYSLAHVTILFLPTVLVLDSEAAEALSLVKRIVQWVYFAVILVLFWLCRRRLAPLGKDAPARKLLDMWGVCMFLYLGITVVVFNLVTAFTHHCLNLTVYAERRINQTIRLCSTALYLLFPIAPLLMTAVLQRSRKMLLMGLVLALVAALVFAVDCVGQIEVFYDKHEAFSRPIWMESLEKEPLMIGTMGLYCLYSFVPGVMLLVFGRLVKRR
ncbi:MAG: hypothetical protein IKS05_02080 [Oscillospiraceae bacterium]|nr:hypothetical protein [Oscillospiraceae bacterium]